VAVFGTDVVSRTLLRPKRAINRTDVKIAVRRWKRSPFAVNYLTMIPILATWTLQEIPDCTIYQYGVGLHRAVACILDPNHDCVRRIVVQVIQLTGQADGVLHSPKHQRRNVYPK